MSILRSIEICAGAGGQALGLEQAGFEHEVLVEIDKHACETLRLNRPHWNVLETDVKDFDARAYKSIDLIAGGVPCPPFSVAGKQLGQVDERDLFPEAIRLVREANPKAIMLENVRGIFDPVFDAYRATIRSQLNKLGYSVSWRVLNSSDYGVPQLRPRAVLVGLKKEISDFFSWPEMSSDKKLTVGNVLFDLMAEGHWTGAKNWKLSANKIAPTIVGGSKKHGGPDLGPTRARLAWAELGVDGGSIADAPPDRTFKGMPRLTIRMVARLQGFPDQWQFFGKKTPAYRQIGNAFPPPIAKAVGEAIYRAIKLAEFSQNNPDIESWDVTVQEASLESIF